MDSITIKAVLKYINGNYVIEPVTQADKVLIQRYADESQKKYLTVNLKNTIATKSYTQLKTAWALINLLFKSMYFRSPTKKELDEFYHDLLEAYAERKPSLLNPNKTGPITFSEMSKRQLAQFIQQLVVLLAESCDLSLQDQYSAKEIFCEWKNFLSEQDQDYLDFYENGEMIPIDKWREMHKVSFASGLTATDEMQLDLAHIVTRGSDEVHRDCCWNTMMLTHEEHMKQHEIGWEAFLDLYPHLRGRVERARKLAGRLALTNKG